MTSFRRDPFVEGDAHEGGEGPVATGDLRQAIGDCRRTHGQSPHVLLDGADKRRLRVTCSRCVGAAGALNDWLQAGFAALTAKANQLEPD